MSVVTFAVTGVRKVTWFIPCPFTNTSLRNERLPAVRWSVAKFCLRLTKYICEHVVVPNANFFQYCFQSKAGVLPSVKYIVSFKAGSTLKNVVVKVEGMFIGRDPVTVTHHIHDVAQRDS